MSDDFLPGFLRDLRTDVEEAVAAGTGEPYSEVEFTRLLLERLSDEGVLENPQLLVSEGNFGTSKYKITGYSLAEDDERLVLVTTLYLDEPQPRAVPLEELRTASERAVRFLRSSAQGLYKRIEPSNTDASDLARKLHRIHQHLSFARVVVLTDGLVGTRSLEPTTVEGTKITYDLFGLERLARVLGEGFTRDDIVVDLVTPTGSALPALAVTTNDGSYKAYLAAIPGDVLADAYERYGTGLLELNVRAFLGVRGRKTVNGGLRATLADEPGRFLAYNNGIVATVDEMDIEEGGDAPRIRQLRGLQIVNGGQTTASVYRARRIDGLDLADVKVPAKIILVPKDELSAMVMAVSRSANSQNTVQPADFSANDPFHVRVEELANNEWCPDGVGRWFYERARGSYGALEAKASFRNSDKRRFARETPKDRRFAKTDLAKALSGWDGHPDEVSHGNQKNFQLFMQRLRDRKEGASGLDEPWFRRLIALIIVLRALQKVVRAEGFSAYQANIVAYTFACLSWATGQRIDSEQVWARQAVSPELLAMMAEWSHLLDASLRETAGSKMPTEWAKRPEAWETIRATCPALPAALPPELANQTVTSKTTRRAGPATELSGGDYAMLDEVRAVSPEDWLRVAAWGMEGKRLSFTLTGIARTMAEYGLAGWHRSPSIKQARWALEGLKAYRSAIAESV